MLNSIVREALLTSVTCSRPPVSFQMSHVSMVPNASRPRVRAARAPGDVVEYPADLARGEVRVDEQARSSPAPSTPAPSAFSRSQNSAVRRSCQTIALCMGSPVSRSHTTVVSRWLVMPTAAISRGAQPGAAERLDGDADLRGPDFLRVVLDPPGPREDLRELLLGDGLDAAVRGEHDRPRTRGALVER